MENILNTKIVGFTLFFVIIALFILNLFFGNCQNSKWHYLIQEYYLPDSIF